MVCGVGDDDDDVDFDQSEIHQTNLAIKWMCLEWIRQTVSDSQERQEEIKSGEILINTNPTMKRSFAVISLKKKV